MGLCSAVAAEGQIDVASVTNGILRGLKGVDPATWDEMAEQLTRTLPEIEPLQIEVMAMVVTLRHADISFSRIFGDAAQANEYADGLRCELFDSYATLADETLAVFARQAIAARNG